MPQIKIEFDVGDTVYVVTQGKEPRSIAECNVLGVFVEILARGKPEVKYKVSGTAEWFDPDQIFKDPWSAFNPDAPAEESSKFIIKE